ncbi:MAG: nucleotidyl transferase AbiEii/AbiGii toxin family protein [Deltaproteobacteria bacterium]|nr:nucleotidyl transferase AbiEii/AbiGii toxin family protein [Deltaproteobacteria bacterium]
MTNGSGSKPTRALSPLEPFDPRPSVEAGARVLEELGAHYALIGGLALNAWGISRSTKDADFAVPVGIAEVAAAKLGLRTIPLRIGGAGVRSESVAIDFIDRRFYLAKLYGDAIEEARSSSRRTQVGSFEIPVVSLEYLVVMKLAPGEPKDDADLHRILELEGLDYTRARELTLAHHGLATANRLDAFARAAGRPEVSKKLYTSGDDPRE